MQFSKAFQLQYRFEEIQKPKFVVVDVDDRSKIDEIARHDMIGELECALADLVTAGQQYERTLRLNGERGNIHLCLGLYEHWCTRALVAQKPIFMPFTNFLFSIIVSRLKCVTVT